VAAIHATAVWHRWPAQGRPRRWGPIPPSPAMTGYVCRHPLADLKRLRRTLDPDLREQHAASPQRDAVPTEWQAALNAKRTADTFETFWSAALDQAAVHWILAIVFIRFLEDNRLLDRPLLSAPGERLDLAAERQHAYVRQKPLDTDTDYLLASFAEAATLPGLAGPYDPAHNPLFRLKLSGDGAIALLAFFRARVPETGALVHDFTDPAWNTRTMYRLSRRLCPLIWRPWGAARHDVVGPVSLASALPRQRLTQCAGQRLLAVWLVEQPHARKRRCSFGRDLGEPRGQQNPEGRPTRARHAGKFDAAHPAGHHHVAEQQVDRLATLQNRESGGGIFRLGDAVAEPG